MKKGTATKAKKPRTKRIVQPEKPVVCQFCGGKGYVELDKVGILIKPCYNCEKGKAQLRMLGVSEDVIARGMPNVSDNRTESVDSGTQQPDNFTRSPDTSQPE